jgi:MFS superfamily sulfate permease-like transporter
VGAVLRGRTVALVALTLGVAAGLIPLTALGGLALLAGLLGTLEVRQLQHLQQMGPPLA